MANYNYKALDLKGKKTSGTIQAADENSAYFAIKNMGLYATSLKESKVKLRKKQMKSKHIAYFTRQLSTMLTSGLSVVQALNIIAARETNASIKGIYVDIYNKVISGVLLSDALEQESGIFPELLINMTRSGEDGSRMAQAMTDMAEYYEKDDRMRKKVMGAMVYPAFLVLIILAALIIIFTVVMPAFFDLFDSMESLPWNTRFLVWLSNMMLHNAWQLILGLIAIVCVLRAIATTDVVNMWIAKQKVHLPIVGKLNRIVYTARFARALGSLYVNGVPLVLAVRSSANTIDNVYVRKQFDQVIEDIQNGILISAAIDDVDGLDPKLASGIYIGEEAGKLNTMLNSIAETFEFEADEATKQLIGLVEPIMIVVLGVIVGFIIISVILPIYQYYQTLS